MLWDPRITNQADWEDNNWICNVFPLQSSHDSEVATHLPRQVCVLEI